jgi:hypothetical protein
VHRLLHAAYCGTPADLEAHGAQHLRHLVPPRLRYVVAAQVCS